MALALLGSSVFTAVAAAAPPTGDGFAAWRHHHNKVYLTSAEEAAARRNFAVNDALINNHNSKDSSFELGHNAYSDQDLASLASRRNGFVASAAELGGARRQHVPRSHATLPSAVDWASAGAVSPVKDQGTCGSCWSFAATGAIEASLFVDRGVSTSLSEEQLIDCDKGAPQDGCKGGAIEEAFRWVRAAAAQFGAIRCNSAQFGAIL